MKKRLLTLSALLLLLSLSSWGQDREYTNLFNYNGIEFSGFGGPSYEISSINGKLAFSDGGGGAVLLNQKYFVGGYRTSLNGSLSVWDKDADDNVDLQFGHGGLWLGYINKHEEMVHLGASLKMGVGKISTHYRNHHDDISNDFVFVMNPHAECEINVTSWFKMNLSLGYRFVSGVNDDSFIEPSIGLRGFGDKDFNSPVVGMSFLFGFFK